MPNNIFTVDLGELSATSSAALSALEDRVEDAEGRLDGFDQTIIDLRGEIASVNVGANPYLLNKLHLASGVLFGTFVPGYYDMTASGSSILTVHDSTACSCCIMSCVQGDIFHIRAKGYSTYGTYAFLNSSNAVIGTVVTGVVNENTIVSAPAGATKIIINSVSSYDNPYVAIGTYTEDDIADIHSVMNNLILMQNNRPAVSSGNVLWVDSDDVTEASVPTVAEMNKAINDAFDSVDSKITAITESEINTLFSE